MANFSEDKDLVNYRPNILNNGVFDTAWAHTEAYGLILTTIEAQWYMAEAENHNIDPTETAMDPTHLTASQFKRLSVYKALELIYISLSKDTPLDDGYFQWAAHFRQEYENELNRLLAVGIEYDWDGLGITQADKFVASRRLLRKC